MEDISLISDIRNWHSINIYRNQGARYQYFVKEKVTKLVNYDIKVPIDEFYYNWSCEDDFSKFHAAFQSNDGTPIGILYYKDVQDFFKRLRINLIRNEEYKSIYSREREDKISYFVCGEYGETYHRPHWHVIMYVPEFENELLSAWSEVIAKSWVFAENWLTKKNVDFAVAAASYAASYVNMSIDVPLFFQKNTDFKPMWHYSHGFGCDYDAFSFDSLFDKIQRKDLRYTEISVRKDGRSRTVTAVIPAYVRHRYFPPFKGFFNLNYEEINELIAIPFRCLEQKFKDKLGYDWDDCTKFIDLVGRCTKRWLLSKLYHEYTPISSVPYDVPLFRYDYAHWYVEYLQALNSTRMIMQYTDYRDDYDYVQCYDNVEDIKLHHPNIYMWFKKSFKDIDVDKYVCSCNKFFENISLSKYKTERFYKKVKQKKVTQLCQTKF